MRGSGWWPILGRISFLSTAASSDPASICLDRSDRPRRLAISSPPQRSDRLTLRSVPSVAPAERTQPGKVDRGRQIDEAAQLGQNVLSLLPSYDFHTNSITFAYSV